MPTLPIYKSDGSKAGNIELKEDIFGVKVNKALIHQAVVTQLHNERQGTVSTKTRGLVQGGGRKPYRQKGTGRARHGSSRSPIWTGGGVIFGPLPHPFEKNMTKKASRLALKSALSAKVNNDEMKIIADINMEGPKTKKMVEMLSNLKLYPEKTLIVTAEENAGVEMSARNIPGVKTLSYQGLNVYDLLYHRNVLFTQDAVTKVEEVLA